MGGGHAPYQGVTHAVDKFPKNNEQRAASLVVAPGVKFQEGDLEKLPFGPDERFDFLYASHVFEHAHSPEQAVSEINRLTSHGYIETPSPLREQLACLLPPEDLKDFHTLFCWTEADHRTLYVIMKSNERIGEFCSCSFGRAARALYEASKKDTLFVEPLLPGSSKTTRLYFKGPISLKVHGSFPDACQAGRCAYAPAIRATRFWSGAVGSVLMPRFKPLHDLLESLPN